MNPLRSVLACVLLFVSAATLECARPCPAPAGGRLVLGGKWYVEFNTNDVGYVRTIMTFEEDAGTFEAYSREGAASETVGWFKLLLAKLFTHYFSHGALLHFLDGHTVVGGDGHSARIAATFASALGDMQFAGTADDSTFHGTLSNDDAVVGSVRGSRRLPAMPLDAYPALANRIRMMAEEKLFDPGILHTQAWMTFTASLKDGAMSSQDDVDMIFKFSQASRALTFSHFYLFGAPQDSMGTAQTSTSNSAPAITLRMTDSNLAVLRIASFAGTSQPIDSCFGLIAASRASVLVIDLRGNAGGNVSAMRVAAHLADHKYAGGAFVTRRWFDTHAAPPTLDQMNAFPQLTEANLDLLFNGIHTQEGLALRLTPDSLRYHGRVFVLVDKGTASACEPLVYALKEYRLAIIVGENTAGAMLNGEQFSVGGGWKLTVPTADFYTADGTRLDRRGVAPDTLVASSDAMRTALELATRNGSKSPEMLSK